MRRGLKTKLKSSCQDLQPGVVQLTNCFLDSHVSVNDMWISFKSEVLSAIEGFIPSKMTKTKYTCIVYHGSIA